VNPIGLADALVESGLDPAERAGKRALFTSVLDMWRTNRHDPPRHVWFVPGRLEVFGKHTDYAGGRALVAAAPRGFAVAASPRDDATIRVVDARRHDTLLLEPSRQPVRLAGWRHYVDTTARRLAKNFPNQPFGADIVIASDLPSAAGMSSSSALIIAIAEALGRVGGIQNTPEWRLNIHGPLDVAGYYACIENGRSFGTLHGDTGVGTQGGSEDHSAIVNGRAGQVLAFAFLPSRALGAARVSDDWRFAVSTSGIKANKTGRVQDAFNQLSSGAASLLAQWNERARPDERAVSLAAALENPAAADTLRSIAGPLRDRLDHFVREDARINPALEAFARADARELGRLAADSQRDAEILLGNQIPETVNLVNAALKSGAFAACSFGAGFGGAAWALVSRDDAERLANQWSREAFILTPGPALIDLSTK
jgi:galactokinase